MTTDPKVELLVGSTWTNVSGDVRYSNRISISGGRPDEHGITQRGSCRFTLTNTTGNYSPRNPSGAYYGSIGRNTQCRVSVPYGATYLRLPGGAGDRITAPDSASLSITGDLDVRFDATLTTWSRNQGLAGKWETGTNDRSWALATNTSGYLVLYWSSDGTSAGVLSATSTSAISVTKGRCAVRATIDVNNGAGGNTVTFYTSTSISGSWTQLGTAVTTTGTTSIYNSTADQEVGQVVDLGLDNPRGKVHAFTLYSGIAGTVVANPDFTAQTAGASSFADTASSANTWTPQSNCALDNRLYRFWGEISAWPVGWDSSGTDVYTSVDASGILRRLNQGAKPLRSSIYRTLIRETAEPVIAYWPLEDGAGATSLASGLPSGQAMTVSGTITAGAYGGFAASDSIVTLGAGSLYAPVPGYTSPVEPLIRLRLTANIPTGTTNGAVLARLTTTSQASGQAARWDVIYLTTGGGTLRLAAYDYAGTAVGGVTVDHAGAVDGKDILIWVFLQQDAGIGGTLGAIGSAYDDGTASDYNASTFSGCTTLGRITSVSIAPSKNMSGVSVGHIHLQKVTDIVDGQELIDGHSGETPVDRMARLCSEEGVNFTAYGDCSGTDTTMGVQGIKTLVELLNECAAADCGLLVEPRDVLGIGYRPRTSLYNQDTALSLSYANGDLYEVPVPTDDDQQTRNDVEVKRDGGSSARVVLETGTLSIQDPPDGVGRYDDGVPLSLGSDSQCADQASWRVHLGTVDEPRYPTVSVHLQRTGFTSDTAALALDLGDRIVIADPPAWLPPDDISVLAQYFEETLDQFEHILRWNTTPESPWRVAVADDDVLCRADTDGSVLASAVTSSGTELSVETTGAAMNNNTGFEDDLTGWTASGGTATRDTNIYYSGGASAKLVPDGVTQYPSLQSDYVLVAASTVYRVDVWVRCAVSRTIDINVNWHTLAGTYISTSTVSASVTAGTWTNIAGSVTSAATAAKAVLAPTVANYPPASNVLWIDNAQFQNRYPLWVTNPDEFTFDVRVGGEVMTVTTVGRVLNSNPFFDTNTTGWAVQGSTISRSTAVVEPRGVASLLVTPSGSSASGGATSSLTGVGTITAAASYLAEAYVYPAVTMTDIRPCVDWYNAAGTYLSTGFGSALTATAGQWNYLSNTLTAPANASQAILRVRFAGTPPSSSYFYVWGVRLIVPSTRTTSPQTFTVTRSVNGVTKAHSTGADVRLNQPMILAL